MRMHKLHFHACSCNKKIDSGDDTGMRVTRGTYKGLQNKSNTKVPSNEHIYDVTFTSAANNRITFDVVKKLVFLLKAWLVAPLLLVTISLP